MDGILGEGGMAIVYRARDMRRPRAVAIKVLRVEIAQLIGTTRFLREIAVTSAFSHPNILPLIDSGEITDEQGRTTPFYVMPLVEGETLHERMVRSGRLPIGDLLRITREILEALQYAHSKGVIHRDIKPANILLSNGHAVVADFGVARPLTLRNAAAPNEPELTLVGEIVGTPTYMSPEQAHGSQVVDARSDLFSVGCVLYEMAVGVRPFDTPIPQLTHARKTQGIYLPTSNHRPDVPAALDEILEKALKPDPAERFASAYEFIEALSHVTVDSKPAPTQRSIKTRRMMGWGVAATLLVAAAAAASPFAMRKLRSMSAPITAPGSDLTRVAVLPIETITPDSLLGVLANGFQTDLIDELAQYPALTVISKNGVVKYRGSAASSDSVAKELKVGSLITGDIRRTGDSVRVTVRLIDGATGEQRNRSDASGSIHDLLAVRSTVLDSVTSFLRKAIGNEVEQRKRENVRSAEAWEIVARFKASSQGDQGLLLSMPVRERSSRFAALDSALVRAAELDERWPTPLVMRAGYMLQRANLEDQLATMDRGASAHHMKLARELRETALQQATAAIDRSANDAQAIYARGKAKFDLWRTSPTAADTLRSSAEADLRRSLSLRGDLASAWNDLGALLQLSGEYEGSRQAAEQALKADAFLKNPDLVVNQLLFTSLATGRVDDAKNWCKRGQELYATEPQFWGCELTILGWTGSTKDDVERAWQALRLAEARDTANIISFAWPTRHLFVAAVAARAGMPDSARAMITRIRLAMDGAPNPNADYMEAYVRLLLNDQDQSLALLKSFLSANPVLRRQVQKTPWFAKLRENPTFLALTASR